MKEYLCYMCGQVSLPNGEWTKKADENVQYEQGIYHAFCALEYIRKYTNVNDEPYIRRELTDQVFSVDHEMRARRK